MTLASGSRLGPYEIVGPLGSGGMGEVFRARDSKLHREVALKILPEAFAQDRERLLRFEREAQLLASLNHPNIAGLYGVEESGGVHALVMELVPGETLAELLARGPLPLEDALPIARQVAEALEEAHEHGVVHRDLKPANVKLTPEGKVKVLDFGLAKALDPNAGAGPVSGANSPTLMNSPTLTAAGTRLGVLLGTAAYMSPEQAKGKPVDRRADIWAFGVVLWEMLSGKPLFEGESVPETLGAIFRQEISLDALPAATPAVVRALIGRCLERDPRSRLRDIGEARVLLQRAEAGTLSPPAGTRPQAPARGRWLAASLGIAAIAAIAGAYLAGLRRGNTPPPTSSSPAPASATSFQKLTSLPGVESDPALSPDGRSFYFVANKPSGRDLDIFFAPVGGKKPIDLTADSLADDTHPSPSPDGSLIAFRSERAGGGLFLMGATGESVRRLADGCFDPSWSPDGRQIVCTTVESPPYDRPGGGALRIVEVESGAIRELGTGDAASPAWSPHGRRIAYWGMPADESGWRDLWTVGTAGGEPVRVTEDAATDWNPVWSPDGRFLHFLSDRGGSPNLWRVAIDEETGRTASPPQGLVLPTEYARHIYRVGNRWVYTALASHSAIERLTLDPDRLAVVGSPRNLLDSTNVLLAVALSPDGRTLAFTTLQPRQDLFVMNAEGGAPVQLTDDVARDRWPSWDPDGSRILFMSNRGGRYETWSIRPDGSALTQLTRTHEESFWSPLLSPDGRRLAASSQKNAVIFDASGPPPWERFERLPNPSAPPGVVFMASLWSPDGAALGGGLRVGGGALRPARYSLADRAVRAYEGDGDLLASLPGGQRVLMVGHDGLAVLDLRSGAPTVLVPASPDLGQFLGTASASRDGRTIVYFRSRAESDVWLAEGIE
jgi:serine/threonine protein kinase